VAQTGQRGQGGLCMADRRGSGSTEEEAATQMPGITSSSTYPLCAWPQGQTHPSEDLV
jgi:hypothetical protein